MNLQKIGIIIGREYQNRVRKKSFLVTTFVVPILMAALCIVPILIMLNSKEKTKTVAVVDRSGIVMPYMTGSETVIYKDYSSFEPDSIKAIMAQEALDGVLSISELDTEKKTVSAELTTLKPFGMDMTSMINSRLNDAVEAYRIESYRIDDLAHIINEIKADVRLISYTRDESGKENISESGVYSALSMVLGLVLFLFITLFGGMVMSAVIEEKSSRVVEVLVSSVKATELMFGKIIGIACVAITQFLLWILLTVAIVSVAGSFIGGSIAGGGASSAELVQSLSSGNGQDISDLISDAASEDGEFAVVLSTLQNLPYARIILLFLVYFIFGYMLYASLYAAIGSAVENEGDTQQLQLPVTIPLMLAYFIAIYTFQAPDSSLAWWGSMIPFTSPIVMLSRLPFGVPGWEIALSVGLLVITFAFGAWVSAKIYKVGILMFGKKSTFKDLWKWLRIK